MADGDKFKMYIQSIIWEKTQSMLYEAFTWLVVWEITIYSSLHSQSNIVKLCKLAHFLQLYIATGRLASDPGHNMLICHNVIMVQAMCDHNIYIYRDNYLKLKVYCIHVVNTQFIIMASVRKFLLLRVRPCCICTSFNFTHTTIYRLRPAYLQLVVVVFYTEAKWDLRLTVQVFPSYKYYYSKTFFSQQLALCSIVSNLQQCQMLNSRFTVVLFQKSCHSGGNYSRAASCL